MVVYLQNNHSDMENKFEGLNLDFCKLGIISGKKYPGELYLNDEIRLESSCLFDNVDEAVDCCLEAQEKYQSMSMEMRYKIVAAIRKCSLELAEDLALTAISETKRGRFEDKIAKNRLAATKTPGPEDIENKIFKGDNGMTIVSYSPFGVFGAVTPLTNPTSTIINNTISMLSAGNGIIFNAHPGAILSTNKTVVIMNEIVKCVGGPANLVGAMKVPTIKTAQDLLSHPKTHANLVTGGPAVVKVALNSGKKCFCAGPGNPPVVVDETADLSLAAKMIYEGASFDNNMICADEKEVFVVKTVAADLIKEFLKVGAYLATPKELKNLEKLLLTSEYAEFKHGTVNTEFVGKSANYIMAQIGVNIPESCRLVICEVSEGHPFIFTELLMPVLAICKTEDFDAAVQMALEAEHDYKHTSSLFTNKLERISQMSRKLRTAMFIVNGSTSAGYGSNAEGYASLSITCHTGEGLTSASTFVRANRMVLKNSLNFC